MKNNDLDKILKENKKVGIITTFLTKQFLSKSFDVFEIQYKNYRNYIEINDISTIIIDNDLYETDHIWFNKDISSLIAYAKLNEISLILLKNSEKKVINTLLDLPLLEITNDEKSEIINDNHIKIPVLVDHHKFNPIYFNKTIDILYIKKGKLLRTKAIQALHKNIKLVKEEIVFDQLSKELMLNIIKKIKESKSLYIYDPSSIDRVLLKFIEIISILQNTPVVYTDEKINSNFAFIANEMKVINHLILINKNINYKDKLIIPKQRQAFIHHTFSRNPSLFNIINNKNKNIDISVITSTNRKQNLKNYISQLNKQERVSLQVVMVTHGFKLSEKEKLELLKDINFAIEIIELPKEVSLGYCLNAAISKIKHPYVAKMDDDDFYFENYLLDSWIASQYSSADLVGKFSTHTFFEESHLIVNRNKNTQRKYHSFVMGATFFCKSSIMKKYMFSDLLTGEDSDFLRRINEDQCTIYADHTYNFCIYRSGNVDSHTWKISDLEFMRNTEIVSMDKPELILSL